MIPPSSSTTTTSESHEEMTAVLKKELRRRITSATQALSDAEVTAQSFLLAEKVCALPEFVRARGVSVYLEMPKEAATSKLLEAAFASNKKVFVPKILGRSADDLVMLQTMAMEDVRSFPKDKWHIPDPPLLMDSGIPRDDALQGNELELVLLPGVAFDCRGGRLGHGKGYYGGTIIEVATWNCMNFDAGFENVTVNAVDSFLRRLTAHYDAIGCPPPVTVGLCLKPQLVEQVPLASHDCVLDLVVTPEEVIRVRTDLLSRLG